MALAVSAVVLAKGVAVVVELVEGRDPVAAVEAARREAMLSRRRAGDRPRQRARRVQRPHARPARRSHRSRWSSSDAVDGGRSGRSTFRWRSSHRRSTSIERDACWRRALDGEFGDAAAITSAFRLGPQRIERAATAASTRGPSPGGPARGRRHPRRRPAAERGRAATARPAHRARRRLVRPRRDAARSRPPSTRSRRACGIGPLVLDGWQSAARWRPRRRPDGDVLRTERHRQDARGRGHRPRAGCRPAHRRPGDRRRQVHR